MENAKRILVTGAGGQLGKCFQKLAPAFPQFEFAFFDKHSLDIAVFSWVEKALADFLPDAVINCSAYTNVEKAESEPDEAFRINVISTRHLAEACDKRKCQLIHFSTDYVFDGKKKSAYNEFDGVHPLSVYGKSKLESERVIEDVMHEYFIIRTSWLYSEFNHNFFKTMLRLAHEKRDLRVVNDQIASPTYAGHLALDVLHLLDKQLAHEKHLHHGLYHYSQEGNASWCDFANAIMKTAGIEIQVNGVATKDYPTKAIRPAYSKLDNGKWKNATGMFPKTWQDGLAECWNNYLNEEKKKGEH